MTISTAWNKKVQNNITAQQMYPQLLNIQTPYQSSVLDGITLVTNEPLTSDFFSFACNAGFHSYLPLNSPYGESYSMGSVTLLTSPRFSNCAKHSIKINPSEAGLSMQQVIEWGDFFVGSANKLYVRRSDFKVDSHGLNTSNCINSIWYSGVRKIDAIAGDQSLYLGGKHSSRSLLIYDKIAQLQNKGLTSSNNIWTRIELRRKYKKHEQDSLTDFMKCMDQHEPFKDALLITATQNEIDILLKRYNDGL